jgi:symplekin
MPRPAPPAAEDEEEYEPDFEPEDAEQIINKLDGLPPTDLSLQSGPSGSLAPYKLPEAPPLSAQEAQKFGDMTVNRAFGMLSSVDDNQKSKIAKGGFNRLAASDYGRDAWVTILSRLATRASTGLEDPKEGIKDEFAVRNVKGSLSVSESVRDAMYQYIILDWKRRIDVAISWLNEEWYNDTVLRIDSTQNGTANGHTPPTVKTNYQRCALRLIDGILPYVEHTDKIILRLLSEVPSLNYEMLIRLKRMAEDPERIDLACNALHYLYMFRPPVRNIVVDVLSEIWRDNDRARPSARKLLSRWKPEILGEEAPTLAIKPEGDGQVAVNGTLEVKAAS